MTIGGLDLGALSQADLIALLRRSEENRNNLEEEKKKLEEEKKKLKEDAEKLEALQAENKQLKIKAISNLNDGKDLSLISNHALAEKIKNRLPIHTYESVNVESIPDYEILGNRKNVRKIELKRETTKRIIIDAPWAFFSTLFNSDSIYVKVLNETGVKQFLLNSNQINEEDKKSIENYKRDIQAAYTQYKTLRIFVPEDCIGEGYMEIDSGSKVIKISINVGKTLHFPHFLHFWK